MFGLTKRDGMEMKWNVDKNGLEHNGMKPPFHCLDML